MCLECVTEAETLIEDIIPGYRLTVAMKDAEDWPKGYYGLVRGNDPDFVWPPDDYIDPFSGMTDEEIEAADEKAPDPRWQEWYDFASFIARIRDRFNTHPIIGWHFINACQECGYDHYYDGDVIYWFIDRVNRRLRAGWNKENDR